MTTDTGDLHLILEGMATRVRDEATASRSRLPVGASIAEAARNQQLTGGWELSESQPSFSDTDVR